MIEERTININELEDIIKRHFGYESARAKIRSLTGKKEEVFKHELEACGFYRGRRVQLICDEEGIHVLPVIPYSPPEHIHHPRCRCTLI